MKIQPIDSDWDGTVPIEIQIKLPPPPPPPVVVKSRLKRLFERPFLRISSSEKLAGICGGVDDFEPSSIVLDKMVRNFMEGSNNDRSLSSSCSKCSSRSYSHRRFDDCSDDELGGDSPIISAVDPADVLKGLVVCASIIERNLLADATAIMDKIKNTKIRKEIREILTVHLRSIGYDAAICKSRWEKSPSYPAGEHEYVDVIDHQHRHRILIDIDFRSEFEIARSTKSYKALLQSLPSIFVGTADRASKIVAVVSEATMQSLKKKGMHVPPWRKAEYMSAKWLATYKREETRGDIVDVGLDGDDEEEEKVVVEVEVMTWQGPAVRVGYGFS